MSFKLPNEAKAEKFIDVGENGEDVREIDIHLAEILRLGPVPERRNNSVPGINVP